LPLRRMRPTSRYCRLAFDLSRRDGWEERRGEERREQERRGEEGRLGESRGEERRKVWPCQRR
jgi:hypothetical protein